MDLQQVQDQLDKERLQHQDDRQEWEKQREQMQHKIVELNQKYNSFERDQQSKVSELQTKVSDSTRRANDHDEENHSLHAANARLQQSEDDLKAKNHEVIDELATIKEMLKAEREAHDSSKIILEYEQKLSKAKHDAETLQSAIDYMENQFAEQQKELDESIEKVEAQQNTIQTLQAEARQKDKSITDLSKKLEEAEDNTQEQKGRADEAQASIDAAKTAQQAAEAERDSYRVERDNAHRDSNGILKELHTAKAEINNLKDDVQRLESNAFQKQNAAQELVEETAIRQNLVEQIHELQQSKAAQVYDGNPHHFKKSEEDMRNTLRHEVGATFTGSQGTPSIISSNSDLMMSDESESEEDEDVSNAEEKDETLTNIHFVKEPQIINKYIQTPGPVRTFYQLYDASEHNPLKCVALVPLHVIILFIDLVMMAVNWIKGVFTGVATDNLNAATTTSTSDETINEESGSHKNQTGQHSSQQGHIPPNPVPGSTSVFPETSLVLNWLAYLHNILRPAPEYKPDPVKTLATFFLLHVPLFLALLAGWYAYQERRIWVAANSGTRDYLSIILRQRKQGHYNQLSSNWWYKLWWMVFVDTFGMNVNYRVPG